MLAVANVDVGDGIATVCGVVFSVGCCLLFRPMLWVLLLLPSPSFVGQEWQSQRRPYDTTPSRRDRASQ